MEQEITFDDFLAVDMRVGLIVGVEDFPEARRPAWKLRTINMSNNEVELAGKKRTAALVSHGRLRQQHHSLVGLIERLIVARPEEKKKKKK
jgi:tRNA-binding protein